MAKQMDEGEFAFLIIAEGNQIGDHPTLPGQRTGYSSIKETIELFRGLTETRRSTRSTGVDLVRTIRFWLL